jgi:hypothetical protein
MFLIHSVHWWQLFRRYKAGRPNSTTNISGLTVSVLLTLFAAQPFSVHVLTRPALMKEIRAAV